MIHILGLLEFVFDNVIVLCGHLVNLLIIFIQIYFVFFELAFYHLLNVFESFFFEVIEENLHHAPGFDVNHFVKDGNVVRAVGVEHHQLVHVDFALGVAEFDHEVLEDALGQLLATAVHLGLLVLGLVGVLPLGFLGVVDPVSVHQDFDLQKDIRFQNLIIFVLLHILPRHM